MLYYGCRYRKIRKFNRKGTKVDFNFTEDKTCICCKSTGPLNLVVMHYTSETKSMELGSYCSLFMEVCWCGKRATTQIVFTLA